MEKMELGRIATYFCLYSDLSLSFVCADLCQQLSNSDPAFETLCWSHHSTIVLEAPNLQLCFEFLPLSLLIHQLKLKVTSTLHP